jgi:hypothetical protein
MTVAERYYTFLDHRWPTNVLISADLDICLDPALVREKWLAFRRRRVLARAMPTQELTLVDLGGDIDRHGDSFATDVRSSLQWDEAFDEEAAVRYGVGVPMRCRYLASPAEGRSRILFIGHHALLDGRDGLSELQAFLRWLDDQELPEQQELSLPTPARTDHPWQAGARERLELLRSLRARAVELGQPGPADWPDVDVPRRLRLRQLVVQPEHAARVVATGRRHGSSAFSTVAAHWLDVIAEALCPDDPAPTLQVAVPADVSVPSDHPGRPSAMSVAVLAHPHRVDRSDTWGVAADLLSTIRVALDRGEGDLFFHLTRVESARDIDEGSELVARALAGSPPCLTISNMGVVDPGSDPAWVRFIQGQLPSSPNQIVFVSTLAYRGQLVHTVSTDESRLPLELSEAMTQGYVNRLLALAAEQ